MTGQPAGRSHHRLRWLAVLAIALVIAALALVLVALATVNDRRQGGSSALEAAAVDNDTLPVSVPVSEVADHLVIDVRFGDEEQTVPVIFDTGAPVLLATDLAARVGGESVGRVATAAIDGTVARSDVIVVDAVGIGDAAFSDVGAVVGFVEPDNPLSCISPNGLLGASTMQTAIWQIDYQAGTITIAPDTTMLDHIADALAIPFAGASAVSPSPVIELPVADGTLTFLVDTGSDGWLAVNPADASAIGLDAGPRSPAYDVLAAGAAGTYEATIEYVFGDVTVDGMTLEGVPIATLDSLAEGQGNLGNMFLSRFVVTIDWPARMLYLDPIAESIDPDPPATAGISWDGESIIVGSVVADPGIADAALQLGSVVSSIDGIDVVNADRDEFCARMIALDAADTFELGVGSDPAVVLTVTPVADFFDQVR